MFPFTVVYLSSRLLEVVSIVDCFVFTVKTLAVKGMRPREELFSGLHTTKK